jgi:hypothetical protein
MRNKDILKSFKYFKKIVQYKKSALIWKRELFNDKLPG